MSILRRTITFLFAVAAATGASRLAADVFLADGFDPLDAVRILLLAATSGWIAWGAGLALNGVVTPARPRSIMSNGDRPLAGRVAILMPVYNEDPGATFSRVLAMARSIERTADAERFEFAILSDTTDPDIAQREAFWFERLRAEAPAATPLYYRKRERNIGKKAGNIADFIRTSGGRYDYLVVLDADSLMEGATMMEMARRMEAEPRLGLLQSLPKIVNARSWFGRSIQFAASFYSPYFARGLASLQGKEGPFWGHNAIIRTRAFAESCGLPALSGKPPFGGHILSHDYVEAAMLARAGWTVRVDPDLEGSFEEGPDSVIDFAKRDRRWCQGNLQHARLIGAPGLKWWSRFTFLQGIMAYLASPMWLLFLVASILAPALAPAPDYFPIPRMPAIFPRPETEQAVALLCGVAGLLIGPKLLITARAILSGESRSFGGALRLAGSALAEILWSSVLAPVTLMFQSRAVLQVLSGTDGGWPSTDREADAVGMREAWAASWWLVATGLLLLAGSARYNPNLLLWFLPVSIPLVLAPAIISVTSQPAGGRAARRYGLFATPQERALSPVLRDRASIYADWSRSGPREPFQPDVQMRPMSDSAAITG